MAHAYTPGLKVTDRMLITKKRILPLKGEVVVKVGDKVEPDTVVARTHLPGNVEPVNVANILGLHAQKEGRGCGKGGGYRQDQELLWTFHLYLQSQDLGKH
jgi:hypothetical protein